MRQHDTHYVPASQITNGKPVEGESPANLAELLEHQVGQATHPAQKLTLMMSLRDATALAKLLRRAYWAGL